jgi:hypothetical protein
VVETRRLRTLISATKVTKPVTILAVLVRYLDFILGEARANTA